MRWIVPTLALAAVLSPQPDLSAQVIAVGGRAGTLGLGGEVAVGLSDSFVLRGGFGVFPYEYDETFEGEEYTVSFPSYIWTAGIDFYLGGGPIRIMGGVLGRNGDPEIRADFTESRQIGDTEYSVPGTLTGTLDQDVLAPFAGIGFGKHTAGGFGFFLDVGAALSGKGEVRLSASGPIASVPGIEESLRQEEEKLEDEMGGLLRVWRIVSIGVKLPVLR
jgi:hypothetical protein